MADYYWVGGNGNWTDYAAHWATSSGGAIFRTTAPTSADNVFFDNNSAAGTFTVTIDSAASICANFDASGITNAARKMTLTGTASVGVLTVNGNWTNPTSTYFAWSAWTASSIVFAATGTLTTNAVTFVPAITINGSGITITLGGALTSNAVTITNGSLDTSSANNYSITGTSFTISANSNTRSLNLNASSITLSGSYTDSSTSGFTLSSGTSTITLTGSNVTLSGGGKTFYNVTFTSVSGLNTINDNNTFNDLSFTAPTSSGVKLVTLSANQTVNGTLKVGTTSSVSIIQRIIMLSNSPGTQRTITMNGASSAISAVYDVDFAGIVIAKSNGSTASFPDDSSRTYRYGNALNNSGITFSAGVSRYWNLSGTQNWNATGWATTNNGTPALDNFPLAQDTATFTEAGAAGTITISNNYSIGTLQMADGVSNRTTAFTLKTDAQPYIYGDFTLFSNLDLSGTFDFRFSGAGRTSVVNFAGVSPTQGTTIACGTGTVSIVGNTTFGSTITLTLNSGTLDLTNSGAGNYTFSTGKFSSSTSNTRSITFGTGNITTTGSGTVWDTGTVTNFSYTGTSTINISNNSATATTVTTGALSESQSLNFNYTIGTYTLTDTSSRYKNLSFSGFTGTVSNQARTIYGNLTINSGATNSAGTSATTFAATSGAQTLTTNGVTLDYPITQNNPGSTLRIVANSTIGATRTYTLTAGTLDLTNNGAGNYTLSVGLFNSSGSTSRSITFGTGNITTTGSGTVWNTGTVTNFSYTGTSTINISNNSATATTVTTGDLSESQALNFNYTVGTYTLSDSNSKYKDLSFSGFTGTVSNQVRTIYGNVTIASGATYSAGANTTTFSATSGTQTLTSNGKTLDFPITQNTPGATFKLIDNLTMGTTRRFTLTAGTLDLNGKAFSIGAFTSTGSLTRSLTFNGLTITITGSGTTAWNVSGSNFTLSAGTGNGIISLTSASTKTFAGGDFVYPATVNQGGAGALTFTGNNTFAGLTNTTQPATIRFTAGTTTTFTGSVTISGTSGNLITVNSVTPGTSYTFTYPISTTVSNLSYCSITDCVGYQNSYWRAYQSNGCVNGGNNLGWIFAPIIQSASGSSFTT